jgi:hypothetical protein
VGPKVVKPGTTFARSAGNLLAGSSENSDACRVSRSAEASMSIEPSFPPASATRWYGDLFNTASATRNAAR